MNAPRRRPNMVSYGFSHDYALVKPRVNQNLHQSPQRSPLEVTIPNLIVVLTTAYDGTSIASQSLSPEA